MEMSALFEIAGAKLVKPGKHPTKTLHGYGNETQRLMNAAMIKYRFVFFLLTLFGGALDLFGQGSMGRPIQTQVWTSEGELMDLFRRPQDGVVALRHRKGKPTERIPAPPEAASQAVGRKAHWTPDGLFWVAAREADPSDLSKGYRVQVFRWDGPSRRWLSHGVFVDKVPCAYIVLSRDWLLAVNGLVGLQASDGQKFPFLRFRWHEEERAYHPASHADVDLGKPFFSKGQKFSNFPNLQMWLLAPAWVRSGDHVLIYGGLGIFYLLDGREAKVRRVMNLMDLSREDLGRQGLLDPFLGMQPQPDGTFLIALRTKDYTLFAGRSAPYPRRELEPGEDPFDPAFRKRRNADMDAWAGRVNAANPRVEWWFLDPVSGQSVEGPGPEGVPSLILTRAADQAFRWRFTPEGKIVLGEAQP